MRWLTSLCLLFLAVALGASDPPRQAPSLVARASVARLTPPQAPPVKCDCPCGPGCPCCEGAACRCQKPVAAQAPELERLRQPFGTIDQTIYRDPITWKRWHYVPGGSWQWLPEVREEVPVPPQPMFHTFAPMVGPMPMMRAVRGGGC